MNNLLSISSCCGWYRWVDPDCLGKCAGFGHPLNEAFRVFGPGGLKRTLTLFQQVLCPPVVDIIRGEHCDPAMPMPGVVPGEERPAEGNGGGDVVEAPREAGMVLQSFELRLGEGVVIADLWAAQRAGHPEVGEQLRGALAGHRRAAVGAN